jgi:hypothetical protein
MTDLPEDGLRQDGLRDDEQVRDDELRSRFVALRREEAAQAPEFVAPGRGVVPRATASREGIRRRRGWTAGRLMAVSACSITILALAWWWRLMPQKPGHEGTPAVSITEWRAPTDFLLETPGRELLRTVPSIGEWHEYAGASGAREKLRHSSRKNSQLR